MGLDLTGFFLFASFAITLLLALEWGGTAYSWWGATIIGLLSAAAVTLLLFVYWEYRQGDDAIYPYSMLRGKVVWSSCLFILLFQGAALIYSYYLPMYFQAVKGLSPSQSGLYNSPGILSQMIVGALSGVLSQFFNSFFIIPMIADLSSGWTLGVLFAVECSEWGYR